MSGSLRRVKKGRPPHRRSGQRLVLEMLGHKGGPPLDTASNWAGFCWRKAAKKARRAAPREVLAIRRRRAAALGLDDATFAAVLSDCGRAPATLVFAICRDWVDHAPFGPRIGSDGVWIVPRPAALKLTGLSQPAVGVVALTAVGGPVGDALREAIPATAAAAGWRLEIQGVAPQGGAGPIADWLVGLLAERGLSPGATLLIGQETLHREIATRARLGGLLAATRYFD